ncbi:taurine dioxygenase [Paramagnetospirillum kuznetsovii]|uniref:Taurine dioxygenase n=1 Tax=Paramagnetospirillum kuznetsovii TaxID=2053833 RepID=A0A364NUG8_9PROT|nr:TauD/TfdA family dioxygenase [Paramagnetospirillum kuznetsovii]RAU20537.1 taurine dioxygenase [Paramagnetospirillum kuznetsovii]
MSFYRDFNDKTAIAAWNTAERKPFETITVNRLSPTIGAEISGVDLSKEIPAAQFDEIRRALDENLAVIFRDQTISRDDQKRLGLRFGTLHRHELAASKVVAGAHYDPEFLSWRTGKDSRFTAGDGWHPDVSCDPSPIFVSLLHVTKTPPLGGDTAFANMYLAYDSLSEPFKLLLDGLTAIHDGAEGWNGYGAQPEPGKTFPASEHPVVATHPRTGRKFLYVNQSFTTHIVQLTRPESDAVLNLLFSHVEKQLAFQTRIHWTPNALLLWDNWATQHHAVWDYYPEERWGDRVSVVTGNSPRA